MCWFRPHYRFPVTAHNHEEAFSDRRRTVITGAQFAILNDISQTFYQSGGVFAVERNTQEFTTLHQRRVIGRNAGSQHANECLESFSSARRIRTAIAREDWSRKFAHQQFWHIGFWWDLNQRSPRSELFDVLQLHHSRFNIECPAQNNPGQTTNRFFYWLRTFGFRKMATIRTEPCQGNR